MISRLLDELKRRGVITVMAPYTVGAWLLLQVVSILQPALTLPDWVMSFSTVILIAGFPIAFYISWFFEFTPEGLRRTTLDPEPSREHLSAYHWAGLGVTSLAAFGVGYLVFANVSANLAKDAEGIKQLALEQSIAVLPFKDQSADQDQAFLAEGIAEELTSLLGRMQGLKVAASSSSFHLAAQDLDPVQIGRRLDVASLLTGSIRAQGDQVKVRVELINVSDGKVLWTENFSRKLLDIFAVEEEVTRSIVNLLQDRYIEKGGVNTQSRTASADAYVLNLKAEEAFRQRTTASVKEARKLFQEAVGLDPEYAAAHVGVAKSVLLLAKGDENVGDLDPGVAATLAEQSLEKALLRAPDLPMAYASLGRVHVLRGEDDDAIVSYDKALALNPNLAIADQWKAMVLWRMQRHEEAVEVLERAAVLDPTSVTILHNLGYWRSELNRTEDARSSFEALVELYPDLPHGYKGLGHLAWQKGALADSLKYWKKAVALSPEGSDLQYDYLGLLFTLQMEEVEALATDPFYAANILLLKKDYEALFAKMDFDVAANPDDPWVAFEAGWYELIVGDREKGAQLLKRSDDLFGDMDRFEPYMCFPGIEFAYTYQFLGETEKASTYLNRCEAMLNAAQSQLYFVGSLDYLEARILSLRGQGEKGALALARAYDHGWREWWVSVDPLTETVRQTAKGAEVAAQIEASLAMERETARAYLAEED